MPSLYVSLQHDESACSTLHIISQQLGAHPSGQLLRHTALLSGTRGILHPLQRTHASLYLRLDYQQWRGRIGIFLPERFSRVPQLSQDARPPHVRQQTPPPHPAALLVYRAALRLWRRMPHPLHGCRILHPRAVVALLAVEPDFP